VTDLVEFLLARIAEDEAIARTAAAAEAVEGSDGMRWEAGSALRLRDAWSTIAIGTYESDLDEAGVHMARWDPARVLAWCEAQRRIVELHPKSVHNYSNDTCFGCGEDWPCPTLRLLALPYVDHPDYRQEWKP
jgi:hypothetical protein